MSLDCYPLGKRQTINLTEQPIALDVAYNDNLLVIIIDRCQTIVVYDLTIPEDETNLIKKFSLGNDIVIDQIVYCQTGDYLACVGHKDETITVYIVFNWRRSDEKPTILEITGHENSDKLSSIDCCQKSGNLAISCGDTIFIYKYFDKLDTFATVVNDLEDLNTSNISNSSLEINTDHENTSFKHVITIRLSIWALKICILENYISVTAADHVQVLKLELLTLQIQTEGCLEADSSALQANCRRSNNSSNSDRNNYSGSLISDSISAATNFSSFNNTAEQLSDSSIITKNKQNQYDLESETTAYTNESADGCITWNLNTKRLVKLPTLMHNTSTNLSSYHICHPLELLGPASESIACRVSASVYSSDYCQNQLEAVVLVCKQFDCETDPVKSTQLQAVYLSSQEDLDRLTRAALVPSNNEEGSLLERSHDSTKGYRLMKSKEHDLLASVTCYVTTLANCFVYTLHGNRVNRIQTISHPDLCVDLRPDLLNVYVLTTMGLQICSTGICDSTFRYEWSSSSDLNLSFIATERTRILTSSRFVIMVACLTNGICEVEYMEKPSIDTLHNHLVQTVDQCDSISIRSNILTYLHAMAQLDLLAESANREIASKRKETTLSMLKTVTALLCKQLLQKKQANVITNGRIDKAIIHLLDISMCDVSIVDLTH